MTMAKFETKNALAPLGMRIFRAPKNIVQKLLNHTTRQIDTTTITSHPNEMHNAALKAEYNKSLSYRYVEIRKLTLI